MTATQISHMKDLLGFFLAPLITVGATLALAIGFGLVTPNQRIMVLEANQQGLERQLEAQKLMSDSLLRLTAAGARRTDVQTRLWCLAFQQSPQVKQVASLICSGIDISGLPTPR